MKKINYLKFILSTVMVIIFTLLFNKMVLGLTFHEVTGLIVGVLLLVHCGLNWRWIKAVTLKVFSRETNIKTKLVYITDLLLLICVGTIIITGIFISKVVFSGLGLGGGHGLQRIHITAAYFALILIGVHLGLHWNWVMNVFKKVFKVPQKKVCVYISRIAVAVVFAFGVYSTYSVGFLSKISFTNVEGRGNGQFAPRSRMEGRNNESGEFAPGQMPGGEDRQYNSSEIPQGGNEQSGSSEVPQWGSGDSNSSGTSQDENNQYDSNKRQGGGNSQPDLNGMPDNGTLDGFNQGNVMDGYENGASSNGETQEESSGIAIQKLSTQTRGSANSQTQSRDKGGRQKANGGKQKSNDGQQSDDGGQAENNNGEQGIDNGQPGFPPGGINGEFRGNFPGGNNIGRASVLDVISSYLGVISMFSIATYYIEKLIKLRKKKVLLLPTTTLVLDERNKI